MVRVSMFSATGVTTMSGEKGVPAPDAGSLFQPPGIWGWDYQGPTARPFDDAAWQARRRQIAAELQRIDAQAQRIGEARRRLSTPRVNFERFWGSAAASGSLLLLIAAWPVFGPQMLGTIGLLALGLVGLLMLGSLAAVAYYWPTYGLAVERGAVRQYDTTRARVQADLDSFDAQYAHTREDYLAAEAHRVNSLAKWRAVPAPVASRRVEVIGGTKVGWEAFLLTYGASLLGCSARLFVLDFTERRVATHLARLAVETGRDVAYVPIPERAKAVDLFAGLSTREFVECLVAAWHDCAGADMNARSDLARDAFVLERICDCLDGDDRASLQRLAAAVTSMLNVSAHEEDAAALLSEAEQVRLQRLFGDDLRRGPQFTDRLLALAAFLHQLHSGPNVAEPQVPLTGASELTLLEITPQAHLLDKGAWASVVVQVLQKRHTGPREDGDLPTHMIVAGVDWIGHRALERLARFTTDAGIQLTILLESLRSEAAEIIGTGDSVQLFMRMGNRKDAQEAAEQLGKQHRFLLSQLSTSESDSISETYGQQASTSAGSSMGMMAVNIGRVPLLIPNLSMNGGLSSGTSWGKQTGKSVQGSRTLNRVHEYVVEPESLQTLGDYAFLYRSGPGQVTAVDCDPEISYSPRATRHALTGKAAQDAAPTQGQTSMSPQRGY
jgi:hypothetical protein